MPYGYYMSRRSLWLIQKAMGSHWKLLRRGMMKSEKCFQVINLEACEGKKKKPCREWGSVLGLEFVGYILLLGLNKGWWNYHRASSEDSGQLNPSTVIHRQLPSETRSGVIMDGEYQGTMVVWDSSYPGTLLERLRIVRSQEDEDRENLWAKQMKI